MEKLYKYTYKFRGLGIGCQPEDMVKWGVNKKYKYEIICYSRKLTKEEIREYELIDLNE